MRAAFSAIAIALALAGCAAPQRERIALPENTTPAKPASDETPLSRAVTAIIELAKVRDSGDLSWEAWGKAYRRLAEGTNWPAFIRTAEYVQQVAEQVHSGAITSEEGHFRIALLHGALRETAQNEREARSEGLGGGWGYGGQSSSVSVGGYFRRDGTYVAPHMRSAGNSTQLDNWSTRGNANPYTGRIGTRSARR